MDGSIATHAADDDYVLGTHDEELVRLGFQHRVWAKYAYALWERAGFAPGQTLLDLGSGPGFATMDLASLVGPTGQVVAVERSEHFVAHLRALKEANHLEHVKVIQADVREIDLGAESIDGAYARWLMCFVDGVESVVERIATLLKPGGVLAVQDYFNYVAITLAPRSKAMDRVIEAVAESFRAHGGDPDVAGRLPTIMHQCGLEVREIRPVVRVARPGSALWNWPTTFFANYLPKLVSMGLLTVDECEAFNADWSRARDEPGTFFCTPPVFEIIAVKPSTFDKP